jgi:predicted AAA+ superfamily ATPase
MPDAVDQFAKNLDYTTVDRIQKNLITVYQDDFNKYRKRIPSERIRRVFRAIPGFIGKKFVYSQVAPGEKPAAISHVLDLLCHARIAYAVKHTSSNGLPLAAEVSSKYFKVLFLDVGLMGSFLGLALPELMNTGDFTLFHQGAVSEQFIGQHLLFSGPLYQEPELYMWTREKANAMAEVDYVISQGSRIIPVEVKAGKSGKLKSLLVFVSEKNKNLAIRFSSEMPYIEERNFKLIHLPLYMVGETLRLLPD